LVSARLSPESLSIFYHGAKEQAHKSPAPVLVLGTGSFVVTGVLPEITHGFISALGLQARGRPLTSPCEYMATLRQLKSGVQSVHGQHKKSGIVELFRTR
jgi:hypothetical protein